MKLLGQLALSLAVAVLFIRAENENCTFTTQPSSDDSAVIENILLVSTLDGTLHAISKSNGLVKWQLADDPILSVPLETSLTERPLFIPNPHDGSLYAYEPLSRGLTKLPLTIPELVKSSPCRSGDGVLYTGKKLDMWISVNPLTGEREKIVTAADFSKDHCARISSNLYIGRSEYNIAMYDIKKDQIKWNATYKDYSVQANGKFRSDHNLLHFASSSDGYLVTVDKSTGKVLWANNFGYPVVSMYVYGKDGDLWKLPVMNMAKETLTYMLQNQNGKISLWDNMLQWNAKHAGAETETALLPSLYIGQYLNNLYALPVMKHGTGVGLRPGILLLPGPKNEDVPLSDTTALQTETAFSAWKLVGYHELPELAEDTFPTISKETPQRFPLIGIPGKPDHSAVVHGSDKYTTHKPVETPPMHPIVDFDEKFRQLDYKRIVRNRFQEQNHKRQHRPPVHHDKVAADGNDTRWGEITFVAVLTSLFTGLIVVILIKALVYSPSSPEKSRKASVEGWTRVDQIELDPSNIVGRGSEGTVVYMGKFDGRRVAVKRVVPQCFVFADREVELLRESDEHPHVIRYFSMEEDSQFRYIALELCIGTLQEYVENPTFQRTIHLNKATVLHQAVQGIQHLHSLGIVHRDVKPSNILISFRNQLGHQRVVISDFGLCKKLKGDRCSFSQRSGMAGTDGWIAPEMIQTDKYRMTRAVDIFSMGCVCYYTLCGKHPFGDSLTRQAKIVRGECSLKELHTYDNYSEAFDLIQCMLFVEPHLRPSADTVVKHPMFWSNEKKLNYLLDVSDRIEKEPVDSNVMLVLENSVKKPIVLGGDWRQSLTLPLQVDLRRFRAYNGDSIRDLLRAMRNKKHHYRELSEDVKMSLGSIPDEFLTYFTKRFPNLLMHTYHAMSICGNENILKQYYSINTGSHLFQRELMAEKHPDISHMQQKDRSPFKLKRMFNNGSIQTSADMDMNWRARPLQAEPEKWPFAKVNSNKSLSTEVENKEGLTSMCRRKLSVPTKDTPSLASSSVCKPSDAMENSGVPDHGTRCNSSVVVDLPSRTLTTSPPKNSLGSETAREALLCNAMSPPKSYVAVVKAGLDDPNMMDTTEHSFDDSEEDPSGNDSYNCSVTEQPDCESVREQQDEAGMVTETITSDQVAGDEEVNAKDEVTKKKRKPRRGKKKRNAQIC